VPYHPEIDEFVELVIGYGEAEFEKLDVHYGDEFILYRAKGATTGTNHRLSRPGGHARAADRLRPDQEMIQTRARVAEIAAAAHAEGMTTLLQDGILKALGGLTDYKQVKPWRSVRPRPTSSGALPPGRPC